MEQLLDQLNRLRQKQLIRWKQLISHQSLSGHHQVTLMQVLVHSGFFFLCLHLQAVLSVRENLDVCMCQLKCAPNIVILSHLKKITDFPTPILIIAISSPSHPNFCLLYDGVIRKTWRLTLFMALNSFNSYCGPAVSQMLRLQVWLCFCDSHCLAKALLRSPQEYWESKDMPGEGPWWLQWSGKPPERDENAIFFPTCHWIEFV